MGATIPVRTGPSRPRWLRLLPHAFVGRERGQAAPLIAAAIGMALVGGVLVVDVGLMFGERASAQTAADLAALAAAQELPDGPSDPDATTKWAAAESVAIDYLRNNDYDVADPDVSGTATANYGGNYGQIEVRVSRNRSWIFGSIFGLGDSPVGARAVAAKEIYSSYALFANHDDCSTPNPLEISGSVENIVGDVHGNGNVRLNGSNNDFDGVFTYRCLLDISGSGNTFSSPPASAPLASPPIDYAYSDFPCDHSYVGDVDLADIDALWVGNNPSSKQLKTAVICATGKLVLGESDVSGTVTLVAGQFLDVSGSDFDLTAYWNDVLFYSEGSVDPALNVSGSGGSWTGFIHAPDGLAEVQGSSNLTINGSIVADRIRLSGSNVTIDSSGLGGVGGIFLLE